MQPTVKAEQLFDVRGHGDLVTGAASGIGLAMAEGMAANGARVTLLDVDRAKLANEISRLKAEGAQVREAVVDVTDSASLRAAIDAAAAEYGRLDAVFANAGISAGPGFTLPAGELAAVAPMNRIARTDEIKGLALLLASPAASFITGTVIPIDGGATAW